MSSESESAPSVQEPEAVIRKRKKPVRKAMVEAINPEQNTKVVRNEDRPDGSLSMSVPASLIEGPVSRTTYWVGVLEECPLQNIVVGGVCFPKYSGNFAVTERGDRQGVSHNGIEIKLSEDEVAAVIQSVGRRVVRKMGKRGGMLVSTDARGYRHNPKTDTPLGMHVYMRPAGETTFEERKGFPSPLITEE